MNQAERRELLIRALLRERGESDRALPTGAAEQRNLLRALFNVRDPRPVDAEVLHVQDEYLQQRAREKGVVDFGAEAAHAVALGEATSASVASVEMLKSPDGLYVWQGDITRLKIDAIVNAANSALLGCFRPRHYCIDNAIHTYAGIQLRLECARIVREQGAPEPTGHAKVTLAYNLPSKFVVHTVGPIVNGGRPSARDCELLAQSYRSCLDAAALAGCENIALCCVSTGVFGFPQQEAAHIAVTEVRAWQACHPGAMRVLFNVFLEDDLRIYANLLKTC